MSCAYLNCEIRFIRDLPIKLPGSAEEKRRAASIGKFVKSVLAAKAQLRDTKLSDRDRRTLEGEDEADEHRIDEAVFALYGVSGALQD